MWSEGGWTGPDYSLVYALSDSPFGPFERVGKYCSKTLLLLQAPGIIPLFMMERANGLLNTIVVL